jgi:metal-responsive CopG/Arc/MetJ family transcriptional regulator
MVPKKRTNVNLDEKLYQQVQEFVKANNSSLSKLTEALLQAFMDGEITVNDKRRVED